MIADNTVIVAFNDDGPVHRPRLIPPLDKLRARLWAAVAVSAHIDGDQDTKAHVADVMNLPEDAAAFVWQVLDAALKVDPFLRSIHTAQRIDNLVRDRAVAVLDAVDSIVRIAQQQEET